MSRAAVALVAGVILSLLGFGVWWLGDSSSGAGVSADAALSAESDAATARLRERPSHTPDDLLPASGGRAEALPTGQAATAAGASSADGVLITDALRAHARAGIREGWAGVRGDTMPEALVEEELAAYERAVLSMAEGYGRHRAKEQDHDDALAQRDDVLALLETLDDGGGPLLELVSDAEAFEVLLAPERFGPTWDGPRAGPRPDAEIPDGATLLYPPGVFRVDLRKLRSGGFPADLTLAGSGRGETLLVVGDVDSGREPMRRFAIRDCTVFTDGDPLMDQRSSVATLVFDRVRFLGFDRGSGSSALFNCDASALLVRDCVIEGGYGRSPDSGKLMDIRTGGLLARFERCQLSRLTLGLSSVRSGATLVFQSCRLDELLDSSDPLAQAKPGVVFHDTSVALSPDGEVAPRDLDELFPGWREAL